jgi:nucleoside-diphosphate-sugar epimerase
MRVFITGGSGYLGRPTIKALIRHGHQVLALARNEKTAQVLSELGAEPLSGELTDAAVLRKAAAQVDGVIHLAQDTSADSAQIDLAAATAMQDGCSLYVHTGGTWVFGDTDGVADETAPLNPPDVVAWRLDNESAVLARGGVIIRPGLVYGQSAGLIEWFYVRPARAAGAVQDIGDGGSHWALVHVEDIAELYVAALSAPAGSVYNGVDDSRLTAAEVSLALSEAAGCPGRTASVSLAEARRQMGPIADAFALDQQFSNDRAQSELGWKPAHLDPRAELAAGAAG